MTRYVASIEARMNSSRLPGKMLMLLGGVQTLAHIVARTQFAKKLDGVVVATTTVTADDAIASWCMLNNVPCHRGSEEDVLARVLEAQEAHQSDVVVELCGDTPFLDPSLIDQAIMAWENNDVDLVTTARNRTLPDGQDVEVFSIDALRILASKHNDAEAREHVSLPFYRDETWRVHDFAAPFAWHRPDLRFVLDTPADAEFLGQLAMATMTRHGPLFGMDDILATMNENPRLQELHMAAKQAAA